MKSPISLIAALTQSRVIGMNGKLPWNLPEDLQRFKQITSGYPVIMGRKTFESIGRPLPDRLNIVISRNRAYERKGIQVTASLAGAISIARDAGAGEIFVIGGEQIYREALPIADRLYLTMVDGQYEGDAFFPEWRDLKWRETARQKGNRCVYLTFERIK